MAVPLLWSEHPSDLAGLEIGDDEQFGAQQTVPVVVLVAGNAVDRA